MNRLLLFLFLILTTACNNKRIVELPEIKTSKITKVYDISPAYIFFDETQADSVELNRKNLISTTNWLVNVDKRLKLSQAIPKIIYIQDKKRNAKMHKNEAAKNYYTCNNKSIKSLGFIDFTDVYYHQEPIESYIKNQNIKLYNVIDFHKDSISFQGKSLNINHFNQPDSIKVFARFEKTMTFQKYIYYKEQLIKLDSTKIIIDNDEFIY